jgi:Nucleotidyl transferase AbiEii toxin, Type IV TA system
MTPAPTRETPAGQAYHDVRNLARRHARDPAEYFTLYALEGFLARLAASEHSADFVLKGGVLMAAFAARRPTRDIDLAASGFPNDTDAVVHRVRSIATGDAGDGLVFDADSIAGATIRDEADYAGVRVTLAAQLASARIPLHVDVNFGDPIWPEPDNAALPLLLGGTLQVRGYPDHMVLAEKIVTAVDRGSGNTRWRDFVDIAAIIGSRSLRQADLASAIGVVADRLSRTRSSHRLFIDNARESAGIRALDSGAVGAEHRWRTRKYGHSSRCAEKPNIGIPCSWVRDPSIA